VQVGAAARVRRRRLGPDAKSGEGRQGRADIVNLEAKVTRAG
jgi:hypothetical protein